MTGLGLGCWADSLAREGMANRKDLTNLFLEAWFETIGKHHESLEHITEWRQRSAELLSSTTSALVLRLQRGSGMSISSSQRELTVPPCLVTVPHSFLLRTYSIVLHVRCWTLVYSCHVLCSLNNPGDSFSVRPAGFEDCLLVGNYRCRIVWNPTLQSARLRW